MTAFAGESKARVKYEYYASQAKKMVIIRFRKYLKKHLEMKRTC